jgi:uncharacterized protein (TIGR03086 family)
MSAISPRVEGMTAADEYRRLAEQFDATVDAVDTSDWDKPSPCEEWTAREVLAHVLESEADVPTKVGQTIERSVDINDDPVAAWRQVRDGMQSLLDDPEIASSEYESLGSTTTMAATIDSFICFDLIVHRWDIARAAGMEIAIADDDLDKANAFLDTMGDMFYEYGASGPPVEVADDESPQVKLLARAGRDARGAAS